jgi:ATP-dependent DNA ligase
MKQQHTLLVQKNSHGRIKFTEMHQDGADITRIWGLKGGAHQETTNTYKTINAGKANELDPEAAATADFERLRKKRLEAGYIEVDTLAQAEQELTETEDVERLDFKTLPKAFCCSKPIAQLKADKVASALEERKAVMEVKYDGLCHFLLCTPEGKVRIYTRRIDDHTEKYPNIVKDLEANQVLVPRSIAVCELVADPNLNLGHLEAFKKVSEVSRVDTLKGALKPDQSEAWARQEKTPIKACVFSFLYHSGENVAHTKTMAEIRQQYIEPLPSSNTTGFYFKPDLAPVASLDRAKRMLAEPDVAHSIEGYVAWMLNEKMEITFNGKPKRRAAYKILLPKEDDVIAYGYLEGTGDHQGKIGSLLIGKLHEDGSMVELGRVGSGLGDDECELDHWDFPQVIQIKYKAKFPTGKYQHPRFVRKHGDKVPEEVMV